MTTDEKTYMPELRTRVRPELADAEILHQRMHARLQTKAASTNQDGGKMAVTENELLSELRFYEDEPRYYYDGIDDTFEPDERLSELCGCVADMIERNYVSREAYEDLRDEFVWETTFLHRMGKKCGTKDVPSLVAYVDKLEAERDELKSRHCPHYHVDRHYCDVHETRINELIAERDEWKAKAEGFTEALEKLGCSVLANGTVFESEGQSKVRAGSSKSVKRAAAAERLWNRELHHDSFGDDIIDALVGSRYGMSALDTVKAICDLLTDEPMDAEQDTNGTCPDSDETCPNDAHSKAHSTNAPKLSELYGILSDEADSLEKLEADVLKFSQVYYTSHLLVYDKVIELLDRQAAITERETKLRELYKFEENHRGHIRSIEEANQKLNERIAELQAKVDSLKRKLEASTDANTDYRDEWHRVCAERADLAHELGECMAERDRYREEVSEMLAIAQQIQRLAAKHDE